MAASTAIAALPAPPQLAKSLAVVVPAELSKSPLLGILGVIMGAGIVTLTGRVLTLGLADLKGHLGIGFDDGAWISSARLEAYTLTFIDGFHLLAWSCVLALLLIALLRRSPLNYGDLSTLQRHEPGRLDHES